MPNSISAEPKAGKQCNPPDVDQPLTQQTKSPETRSPGNLSQPHLRIVHSIDRLEDPTSANMPSQRNGHQSDRPPAMLDRTVQAQIGRMLRDSFADIAGEPVPERFVTLLAELEAKEKSR